MIHKMRLVKFAFDKIKEGTKDIEVRLYDEKRQLINIGDTIEFECMDTKEIIKVSVIALHRFNTFKELFSHFDNTRLGLSKDEDISIMNKFYSPEEQQKYGVIGIEIKLIN